MRCVIAGLTGTTGAGKSTAAKIFASNGAYVIDCDLAAREVVEPNTPTLKKLCEHFGFDILNEDKSLNRRLLASRAFKNPESTQKLNDITQPAITELVREKMADAQNKGYEIIVIDAPVLFSSPLKDECDVIICVTAPLEERIERLLKRDNRTREEILKRISAQKSEEFYINNSDIIIDNAEGIEAEPQVLKIIEKLKSDAKSKG